MARAFTIKQPWAHLIAIGIKDVENRTWPTQFRGTILIHAAKNDSVARVGYSLLGDKQLSLLPRDEKIKYLDRVYERSAIIGQVDIVDCVYNKSSSIWAEPGLYHWCLENAKLYDSPIKNVKGKLSFWEYEPIILV